MLLPAALAAVSDLIGRRSVSPTPRRGSRPRPTLQMTLTSVTSDARGRRRRASPAGRSAPAPRRTTPRSSQLERPGGCVESTISSAGNDRSASSTACTGSPSPISPRAGTPTAGQLVDARVQPLLRGLAGAVLVRRPRAHARVERRREHQHRRARRRAPAHEVEQLAAHRRSRWRRPAAGACRPRRSARPAASRGAAGRRAARPARRWRGRRRRPSRARSRSTRPARSGRSSRARADELEGGRLVAEGVLHGAASLRESALRPARLDDIRHRPRDDLHYLAHFRR